MAPKIDVSTGRRGSIVESVNSAGGLESPKYERRSSFGPSGNGESSPPSTEATVTANINSKKNAKDHLKDPKQHPNYKITKEALAHTKFWIPHSAEGYTLGQVKDDPNTIVSLDNSGKSVPLHIGQIANPPEMDAMPDNTNLMHLNEATMLHNIRTRYAKNLIYTYTGYILIAVNPYKTLPIYSIEEMERYYGRSIGVLPPHVFAVADRTYRMMKSEKTDQAILISGESGAGKTETAKKVMQFLVQVGGRKDDTGIEDRIIATNPLLEAFGNAKTPRNNNSSRFGKFMKIDFNNKAQVTGSTIVVYLLEKSRLVNQEKGNRCYHIFYQICLGTTPEEQAKLHVSDPSNFIGISSGGDYRIPAMNDVDEFKHVRKAMDNIGMKYDEQFSVFRIVAGLLHLSNIKFTKKSKSDPTASVVKDDAVKFAAELLDLDAERLADVLVSRILKSPRGSSMKIYLSEQDAIYGRDAIIKGVYGSLFLWLVQRINVSLKEKVIEQTFTSIGVLDIFGFEFFDFNSFEQLCINFCNEKLQQQFNQCIFKQELEIYAREAIRAPTVNFIDNQDCIDLFETPAVGLLALLDEQNKLPKGTDKGFCVSLHTKYGNHKRVAIPTVARAALMAGGKRAQLTKDEGFVIRHYAADVCYDVRGFLDKNNDSIHEDLEMCLKASKSELLVKVMDDDTKSVQQTKGGSRFKSVSGQFSRQLKDLVAVLNNMTCHFIRCIKPNEFQKPDILQNLNVMDQLRCNGMFDALTLMHEGYPTRCPYGELYDRFAPLLPKEMAKFKPSYFCEALIMALDCAREDFQLGLTKLFFRSGKMAFLDDLKHQGDRGKIDPAVIIKVNKYLRRKMFRRLIFSVLAHLRFTARLEMLRAFRNFKQISGVLSIMSQNWLRAARKVRSQRAAAKLEALVRMYNERRLVRRKLRALIVIQRYTRGFLVRKKYGADVRARGKAAVAALQTEEGRKRMADIMKIVRAEDEERKRIAAEQAEERRRNEAARQAAFDEEDRKRREAIVEEEKRRKRAELMEYLGPLVDEKEAEIRKEYDSKLEKEKHKVNELESQLREKSDLSHEQVEILEKQLVALNGEMAETKKQYQQELSQLKHQIEDRDGEVSRIRKQANQLDKDNSDLRTRLNNMDDQITQVASQAKIKGEESEAQKRQSNQQLSKQAHEMSMLQAKLDESISSNAKLNDEITSIQQQLDKESRTRAKEKQEAAKLKQDLEQRLDGAMSKVDESTLAGSRALSRLKEDMANLNVEKDQLENDNANLSKQVSDLTQKVQHLSQAQSEAQKEFDAQLAQVNARGNQLEVDNSVMQVKYDALLAEIERLKAEIERLRREKEALANENADLQAQIEDLQSKLNSRNNSAVTPRVSAQLQEELEAKDAEVHRLSAQNKLLTSKVAEVKSQLTSAQAEITDLEEKAKKNSSNSGQSATMLLQKEAEWSAQRQILDGKVKALEEAIRSGSSGSGNGSESELSAKVERLQTELEKAREQRKASQQEISNLRAEIDDANNQISIIRKDKASLSKETVELKLQVEQLNADVEELQAQLDEASDSRRHESRMRGLNAGNADSATELAIAQSKVSDLLAANGRLETELRTAQTKSADDVVVLTKLRSELISTRGSLEAKVEELQSDLDDANVAHQRATAQLREEIQNLRVEYEQAVAENKLLNERLTNPAQARTARRGADELRRQLEDKVEELSQSESKLTADRTVLEAKVQNLNAEVDRLKEAVTRGQQEREPIVADNVALNNRVDTLNQRAEKAERANEKLRQRLQLLESSSTGSGAGGSGDVLKSKIDSLRQELDEVKRKTSEERSALVNEVAEKDDQLQQLNRKVRNLQQEAEESTLLRTQLDRQGTEHRSIVDNLRAELARQAEESNATTSRLQNRVATLEDQIQKGAADADLEGRCEVLEVENKRLKDERAARQEELSLYKVQLDDASRESATLKREKQDASSESQQLKAKIAQLQSTLDESEDKYVKLYSKLNEGTRLSQDSIQLQSRLDEAQTQLRLANDNLRAAKAKSDLEIKSHERSKSEFARKEASLESKIEDLEMELSNKQREILSGLSSSSGVKEEIAMLRREKDGANRDKQILQQKIDDLEQELIVARRGTSDSRKRLEDDITTQSARAQQFSNEKSVLELKLDSMRQELERVKRDSESVRREKDPLLAENRRLKSDMEQSQIKLEKTMRTLERLRQKLRQGVNPSVDAEAGTQNLRLKLDELQDIIQESFTTATTSSGVGSNNNSNNNDQ